MFSNEYTYERVDEKFLAEGLSFPLEFEKKKIYPAQFSRRVTILFFWATSAFGETSHHGQPSILVSPLYLYPYNASP
jgi:hypothetical protein